MRIGIAIRLDGSLDRATVLIALICLMPAASQRCMAQDAAPTEAAHQTGSPVVLDRAVAVVNKHVILQSDLEDEMRISVLEPKQGAGEQTPQRALEELIGRTLIEQQIRTGEAQAFEPTDDEVAARLHELRTQMPVCVRQNCASDAGWAAFLAAYGLTTERVEAYLRYRMEILSFIEQRFRQGVQISQQEIETYYRDTLLPQYEATQTAPSLKEVSRRIQEILLQQQVNRMFDVWLMNLREQGDVQVLDPSLAPPDAKSGTGGGDQ